MYLIGTAKTDITAFVEGIGMMGYGMHFNVVKGVSTPLHARAFVIENPETGKKIVFVNAEVAFIGVSLKLGVLKKLKRSYSHLGFTEENVIITAQHTHSGPGGYNQHGFYNFTIPGFVPEVYLTFVNGMLDAIVQADANKQEARMFLHTGSFPLDQDVAFNRSIKAYNRNPDVIPVSKKDSHTAVNREMVLLRMESPEGKPLACLNWFGIHPTSFHNDNTLIHFDNKGYASYFFEEAMQKEGNEDFVAAFAQSSAGDVSPNYVWDRKKKWTRGKYEKDDDSARHNGNLQYQKALEIFNEAAQKGFELKGDLDFANMWVNFANVQAHPDFTGGRDDCRTGASCHGVSFFAGTVEGPGMPWLLSFTSYRLTELTKLYEKVFSIFWSKERRIKTRQKYRIHGKKHILVETGERRVLATPDVKNLVVPGFLDKTLKTFKDHHRRGGLEDKPWIPQVLPLQIVVLGQIALALVPAEPTTVAGRRLRAMLEPILAKRGIERVIISPYANGYCGYVTTYEEYQLQAYEGGHTVFGEWTHAAFMTKFRSLAMEMVKKAEDRKIQHEAEPVTFCREELSRRSWGYNPISEELSICEC